jgi:hypothetical protein
MGIFRNKFFKWFAKSLIGHIVFLELFFGLSAWALETMRAEGTLTAWQTFRVALITAALSFLMAGLFWYTVTLPLIRSRNSRG